MGKKYEVVCITGKYTNKDGEEKSRYANVGAVLETKNGLMLKLETVPVGWDGWAYLNLPKDNEDRQAAKAKPAADDDFPPF